MSSNRISRRELLKAGTLAGAAEMLSSFMSGCGGKGILGTGIGSSSCAKITDIEHVVILL